MKFDVFAVGEITIDGAKDFCERVISKTPRNDLSIFLSSEGGDVNGALTMGSAIQAVQRQGKSVHIHVGGCAYSAGVLLLQFANHRSIEPYTSLLIHPATFESPERPFNLSDLNGAADDLSWAEHCYFEVIERRSGYEARQLLENAHYRKTQILLYPLDCLKWSLVDEIIPYALPEHTQKNRVPNDDSLDNVIPIASAPRSFSAASDPAQKSSRSARGRASRSKK